MTSSNNTPLNPPSSNEKPAKKSVQLPLVWQKRLTVIFVIVGVVLICFFGLRTFRSFVRLQREGLRPGVTDVEAIRPWMNIDHISKAYQVPEDYIFAELGIPFNEENSKMSLGRLNKEYHFEPPDTPESSETLVIVKRAIKAYQIENPPPTEVSP